VRTPTKSKNFFLAYQYLAYYILRKTVDQSEFELLKKVLKNEKIPDEMD